MLRLRLRTSTIIIIPPLPACPKVTQKQQWAFLNVSFPQRDDSFWAKHQAGEENKSSSLLQKGTMSFMQRVVRLMAFVHVPDTL